MSTSAVRHHPPRRFPSLWHLLCLAIVIFLSISGHVSLQNAAVVLLSSPYLFLLSAFSFPSPPAADTSPIFPSSRILPIYVLFAGVIGLLLPLLHLLFNDGHASASAGAPHLFLLCVQVLMEGVAYSAQFSVPVRAFVPIFYNSVRIPAAVEWTRIAMTAPSLTGKGLALLNLGLWSYNLLGFLLPVYLPRALKRYYSPTA